MEQPQQPIARHAGAGADLNQLSLNVLFGGCIFLFTLLALKNAWIADDAGLTLRTIDNLLHGFGPTWNADERVQAYTHPLWMLTLALVSAITREYWFTTIAVSIICSVGAVLVLWRRVPNSPVGFALALTALCLSQAFIDFSSSGLENPLAHLLLAIFAAIYLHGPSRPRALAALSLVAGLIAINRLDHVLLVAPALLLVASERISARVATAGHADAGRLLRALWSPELAALAVGVVPPLIWHSFTLIYYGFPFPNTAYAKLNTGIPGDELARQGLIYIIDSLRNDPLVLLLIAMGIVLPLTRHSWRAGALSLGLLLYLAYIVRIGGDFMTGRFFTAPMLLAATLVMSHLPNTPRLYAVVGLAAIIGLLNPNSPLVGDSSPGLADPIMRRDGIIDERRYYFNITGIVNLRRDSRLTNNRLGDKLAVYTVAPAASVGMIGLQVGPRVHLLDFLALGDPLLARLPAIYDPNWRIGHFRRVIPDGYAATLETGVNQIADPQLAAYYDRLRLVVRGPLFDPERLRTIWRLNRGSYNSLINTSRYRYPDLVQRSLNELAAIRGSVPFTASGIRIGLGETRTNRQIELMLGQEDGYRFLVLRGQQTIYEQALPPPYNPFDRLALVQFELPEAVAAGGYDQLWLLPQTGLAAQVGRVRFLEPGDQPSTTFILGGHWAPPDPDEGQMWVRSPASIIVDSATPGTYLLNLTPTYIYDPAAPERAGTQGNMVIQAGSTFSTTVAIQVDVPIEVRFDLPAGRQVVSLSLATGNYRPTQYDRNYYTIELVSFRVKGLRLRQE